MAKEVITREQIEKIVYEELAREGFLNRVMARAKGNMGAIKQLGSNTTNHIRAIAQGKIDVNKLKDPKLVKNVTIAVERIKSYQKKFAKLLFDFSNDLEIMLGPDLTNNPELNGLLKQLDNSSTSFAKEMGDVGNKIQAIVTGVGKNVPEPEDKPISTGRTMEGKK